MKLNLGAIILTNFTSLLAQERGLKHLANEMEEDPVTSLLAQERGLKHLANEMEEDPVTSLLAQERGLKHCIYRLWSR